MLAASPCRTNERTKTSSCSDAVFESGAVGVPKAQADDSSPSASLTTPAPVSVTNCGTGAALRLCRRAMSAEGNDLGQGRSERPVRNRYLSRSWAPASRAARSSMKVTATPARGSALWRRPKSRWAGIRSRAGRGGVPSARDGAVGCRWRPLGSQDCHLRPAVAECVAPERSNGETSDLFRIRLRRVDVGTATSW